MKRTERYIRMEAVRHSWKICGACVQGLNHLSEGIPCQDKIYFLTENGIAAIALADGAGSASLSHIGAETAALALCEKFCRDFGKIISARNILDAKKMILDSVLLRLMEKAEIIGCDIHELASTLLGAACSGDSVLFVHIGDGVAACFKEGGTVLLSAPDSDGFANETFFMTSDSVLQRMKIARAKLEGIGGFALMSDGTDSALYDPCRKKFASLLDDIYRDCVMYGEEENNSDLEELLSDVIRQRTNDDCGLIAICRSYKFFRGYRDLSIDEQYDFLGIQNTEAKKELEKIFGILSSKEYIPRSEIVSASGFRRRKILGMLRRLNRKGFIRRCSKSYLLGFDY